MSKFFRGSLLAATLTVAVGSVAAFAAPGDTNSVNNGRDVQGGTYYNTNGSETVFQNTGNGGLWLHSGTTVRGLEVNGTNQTTGNGGAVRLSAPGNIVRLDGTIDVSAMRQGTLYTGNGGKVTIDSGYLYQNGNVLANGRNGGQVLMNVGAATFGPAARIQATGSTGAGGTVTVNANGGVVDIQQGAIVDTSGKLVGNYNTNLISIESGVVNNAGILRANGSKNGNSGGTIRLVSDGNASFTDASNAIATANTTATNSQATVPFTTSETNTINTQGQALATNHNGEVINSGTLQANGLSNTSTGGSGADGGTIDVQADTSFINSGQVTVNGSSTARGSAGNGGLVSVQANNDITNTSNGLISSNGGSTDAGTAGSGGALLFDAGDTFVNDGQLQANGGRSRGQSGDGGFISVNADSNLTNNGQISSAGGSTTRFNGRNGVGGEMDLTSATGNVSNSANGTVAANGGSGGFIGGAAGSVFFDAANQNTNAGSLQATGGNGSRFGGSGGTLNMESQNNVAVQNTGTANVNGGTGGVEAGTVGETNF